MDEIVESLNIGSVTQLNLSGTYNALSFNSFLVGNQIGASGASQIAEALKQNSSLKILDLSGTYNALSFNSLLVGNQIGASGASHIVGALKQNSSLKILNLWGT